MIFLFSGTRLILFSKMLQPKSFFSSLIWKWFTFHFGEIELNILEVDYILPSASAGLEAIEYLQ